MLSSVIWQSYIGNKCNKNNCLCYGLSLGASASFWEGEGFAGLRLMDVVQRLEQHVIYRLKAGGGREDQANMEETDGERLP